jgi:hypothetical protein
MTHKLANGPCTLEISAATPSMGNFGPQICFVGTDGTLVYVNDEPAKRGLKRLSLDLDTVIGQTIRFSQVKKDGKTFTNLDRAGEGTAATPAAAAAPAAPRPQETQSLRVQHQLVDWVALATMYRECVAIAMATLGTKCEEAGIPIDASAIQSAAATLFIKATR